MANNAMSFYINANDSSGALYLNKQRVLNEISDLIDQCQHNGGTEFDIQITCNANPYAVDPIKVDQKERRYIAEDTCACCGAPIPEGRMVCPACEAKAEKNGGRKK